MSVGKDTIQTLLRQRQALREALLELRNEIATLDASSQALVSRNIRTPRERVAESASDATATKAPAAASVSDRPEAAAPSLQKEPSLTLQAKPSAKETPEPVKNKEENPETAPRAPTLQVPRKEPDKLATKESEFQALLEESRELAAYFLRHPAPERQVPLAQLDEAIAEATKRQAEQERETSFHALQNAYRNVAGEAFAELGINGETILDSRGSVRILWMIPLAISLLVVVVFPLLLLGRTLALRMFTGDFATDMIWVFGLMSAFLWGIVGSLTLLTLEIAVQVRRRRYEADIRRSPGLRGTLGGVLGCGLYAGLEIWLPLANITAEFFLTLMAFAGGLVSWILFLSLQRGLCALIRVFDPAPG